MQIQNLMLNPVVDAISLAMASEPPKKLHSIMLRELAKRSHYLDDTSTQEILFYARDIGILQDGVFGMRPQFKKFITERAEKERLYNIRATGFDHTPSCGNVFVDLDLKPPTKELLKEVDSSFVQRIQDLVGDCEIDLEKPLPEEAEMISKETPSKLLLADCFDAMAAFPDGIFDATITDPPYGISSGRSSMSNGFSSHQTIKEEWDQFENIEAFAEFNEEWLREVCRVTKVNGNIAIFGSMHSIFQIGAIAQKMDLKLLNMICWSKPNAQPNITCRTLTASSEYVLWLCNNTKKKATAWTFNYETMKEINDGKQMRDVWTFNITPPSEKKEGKHPTQKPQSIMQRLISMMTNEDDLVFDPFAGSGSTLLAAQELGRRYVGCEKNPEYFAIAKKRIGDV